MIAHFTNFPTRTFAPLSNQVWCDMHHYSGVNDPDGGKDIPAEEF